MTELNRRAQALVEALVRDAGALKIAPRRIGGALVIDCGVEAQGGLEAGRRMAEICLAGLGEVRIAPGGLGEASVVPGSHYVGGHAFLAPLVVVRTDQPVAACMASQYAGWQIARDGYFAMGSGPMRAVAAKEELYGEIGEWLVVSGEWSEPIHKPIHHSPLTTHQLAVGVLESGRLPPPEVCQYIAQECRVSVESLTLLVAPTASLAGTVQVVARSVETALHKLHELKFDLGRVVSGFGSAPLPPVAAYDLTGIGRTNDAVLYGGEVTLWVTGDDASLQAIGPQVPSSASADHGVPFIETFERYGRDFYQIDRQLFSPALVSFMNVDTGRTFRFGRVELAVLRKSFGW